MHERMDMANNTSTLVDTMRLSLATLRNLPEAQRNKRLGDLVTSAKGAPNGRMTEIQDEILGYETKYKMSSEELRRKLSTRELSETDEISVWLFQLSTRRRVLGF